MHTNAYMHDCHRPDSPNTHSQTCRFCAAGSLWLCVCVCVCVCVRVPVVFFTSSCPCARVYSPLCLLHTVHLYVLFAHPYLSEAAWRHLACVANARQPEYIPTLMPCLTQLRNHPHAKAEACGNAVSELKKTRDETLPDSQRWCLLGSTSPGLTVSENIFNYSTWRIEKPETEERPFNM